MDKTRDPKGYYEDDAGRTAMFHPDWDSTFDYILNDIVFYGGRVYYCIQIGRNKNPLTETAYWTRVPSGYTA
jgi:hypothetical protein